MARRVQPFQIYNLLPKTNCGECGEATCLAFAVKIIDRAISVDKCPHIELEKREEMLRLIAPPVKAVTIGVGDRSVTIGGEEVVFRHELTYFNPTAIAIDVDDEMGNEELIKRLKAIEESRVIRVGRALKLNLVAVRSTSGDPKRFLKTVSIALKKTNLPIILCSFDPLILEEGLKVAGKSRPLIYAATKDNWEEVGRLASSYDCPVAISSKDLNVLSSLSNTLISMGIHDIVLDPGTFPGYGLINTVNNFTIIRRASVVRGDKLLGFPIMGIPAVVWMKEGSEEEKKIEESCLASILMARYASLLIMHSLDPWALLPVLTWREDLFTDPRRPATVSPGLSEIGEPDENSPVMITTNFALTVHTVTKDIEESKVPSYLLVVDTGGLAVRPAIAGRRLTADKIASLLKESGIESRVKHRKLIVPGFAAALKGEIEDLTGWEVIVGPIDSSDISEFLRKEWKA